ncbi:MAG TPA: HTTM domain-containing protein [Cyanothece sp. UBA12306]|nr:HTTM domain-containing protein [Cyanothece sp. UBA12306]
MFKFKVNQKLNLANKTSQKQGLLGKLKIFQAKELLSLDLRSLALFRISLAILIILDLLNRSQDIKAHYTESGVFRLAALTNEFSNEWFWSFHFINGSVLFQTILFCLAGLLAILLLIGYRTRLITIISWVFLVSLQNRNTMILSAGDTELRLLLFWSIFLPLGAYYSVDNALNSSSKKLPKGIFSGATIALILQICFIYWFSALFKIRSETWQQGIAVYNSLSPDFLITPLGAFLRNFTTLLVAFTFVTIWFELLGPFLLFIPLKNYLFRYLAIFLFISLHLSFGMVFRIGLFPLIGATAWLAFLPSDFWERIDKKLKNPHGQKLTIHYNQERKNCKKYLHILCTFLFLSEIPILSYQNDLESETELEAGTTWFIVDQKGNQYSNIKAIIYLCRLSYLSKVLVPILKCYPLRLLGIKIFKLLKNQSWVNEVSGKYLKFRPIKVNYSWLTNIITLFLVVLICLWNIRTIDASKVTIPQPMKEILSALDLTQKWSMFSTPDNSTEWYVIAGQLKDGTEIDVFRPGKSINWDKPDLQSAAFKNMRWRKYLTRLDNRKYKKHRLYYGKYLCSSWNSQNEGDQKLERFSIYYLSQETDLDGKVSPVEKENLWDHRCFKK